MCPTPFINNTVWYSGNQFVLGYDYDNGHAWYPMNLLEGDDDPDMEDDWFEGDVATKAQTQGKGKVTAIQNVCYQEYYTGRRPGRNGYGPIAGFMDSTGDFNFCTEFRTLQVVCCFNRANRKVTDGGGLIAEMACYEADELGYDYDAAQDEGDTLYVLQGRNENGLRSLLPRRETLRLGSELYQLFREQKNYDQLAYFSEKEMEVKESLINS